MEINPIMSRLKEHFKAQKLKVQEWGEAEAILKVAKDFKVTPAIFIVFTGGTAQPPRSATGAHIQIVTHSFSVIVVTRTDSKNYREAVIAALIGFIHPSCPLKKATSYQGWSNINFPDRIISDIKFNLTSQIRKDRS